MELGDSFEQINNLPRQVAGLQNELFMPVEHDAIRGIEALIKFSNQNRMLLPVN